MAPDMKEPVVCQEASNIKQMNSPFQVVKGVPHFPFHAPHNVETQIACKNPSGYQ